MSGTDLDELKHTPLNALHERLGGKMVPFAGYSMPVQYPAGILAEHAHTRAAAGLFDVSHMGQARLSGADAAAVLESLTVGAFADLADGRQRYTLLTNERGGIIDDLMVCRDGADFFIVVNASRKDIDLPRIAQACAGRAAALTILTDRALLALQGPKAAAVFARLAPDSAAMTFMTGRPLTVDGAACFVTRSGYTGEDGFEISVPAARAVALAERLLTEPEVAPVGLGARDSLRLEAGLCLYGNDIDETTTPVEAGLLWAIPKTRRDGRGYPGAAVIAAQIDGGAPRKRVGLKVLDRAPARAHTEIKDAAGQTIGEITSGGPSPTLGWPIAMGYVAAAHAAPGTTVHLVVRNRVLAAEVVAMPFVPQRYHRGPSA